MITVAILFYPQENAALCDEIAHLEEKFLRAKEERRWVDRGNLFISIYPVFFLLFSTFKKTQWFIHIHIDLNFQVLTKVIVAVPVFVGGRDTVNT